MGDLKNELVWSHSRARAFKGCKRAYWLTYYGSWGGWDAQASPEAREAYVQKKLTTRAMWTGTVVHGVAETAIRDATHGRFDDVDRHVANAARKARTDIADSANGRWLGRPARRVGFREHYYGEPVTDADWDAALAEIERQVRSLFENKVFRRILDVPARVREVEQLQRFPVGDAEVYVSLDALMDDGKGGVVIIDWKTGEAHSDEVIAAQLGVYGLYATEVLGVPPDRILAMHVNLRHDTRTMHPVGPREIEAARADIREGVAEMRALLADVRENVARKEDHPQVEETDPRCRWCSFRRTCGREK
ncbi:MAG: PD-(D/E)XK nuclease family protein [Myxococcota bacterium]